MKLILYAIALVVAVFLSTLPVRAACDPVLGVSDWAACSVNSGDDTIECWGTNQYSLISERPSVDAVWLDGGDGTMCVIYTDTSIGCWGLDADQIVSDVPGGTGWDYVVPGTGSACALNIGAAPQCWGDNVASFDTAVPVTNYGLISGGQDVYCGISSGAIDCWGFDMTTVEAVPAGTGWTDLEVTGDHACAHKNDDTLDCWGDNSDGQNTVPAGNYLEVAVAVGTSCAIKTDNTLDCWGTGHGLGLDTPPSGTFTILDCSGTTCCAVATDGDVECWGDNAHGLVAGSAGSECTSSPFAWISLAVGM